MKALVSIIVALLLVIGGGAYYFLSKEDDTAKVVAPQFYPLERFVISLDNVTSSRYLVLELTLLTHDANVMEQLPVAAPLLNNNLVEHFSKLSHGEVKALFKDIPQVQNLFRDRFNETLRNNKLSYQIEQVLVTNVFIQ